jgi:hypothetical protein
VGCIVYLSGLLAVGVRAHDAAVRGAPCTTTSIPQAPRVDVSSTAPTVTASRAGKNVDGLRPP